MRINSRFAIERDAHNYIVVETTEVKQRPGKKQVNDTKESRKFYPSLQMACNSIINKSANINGDLNTVLLSIDFARDSITEAIDRMEKRL